MMDSVAILAVYIVKKTIQHFFSGGSNRVSVDQCVQRFQLEDSRPFGWPPT